MCECSCPSSVNILEDCDGNTIDDYFGCIDYQALNYNSNSEEDDGSCYYCHDVLAYQCDPPVPPGLPGSFEAPQLFECYPNNIAFKIHHLRKSLS